jgi:mRNA interferase MazF
VRRGDVYDARLDPTEGSEQAGSRPVVIVSRDAINTNSAVVVVVPCTTFRPGRRIYPTQVLLDAGEGGLSVDSVVLCEQVRAIAKTRLVRRRGTLARRSMARLERALLITLDLPGVPGSGPLPPD